MKVSIITAVFDRVDTISSAVSSVQSQRYENVEHVIQDGGSKDGTLDKIRNKLTCSMKLVSEPDKGIYDAINKGISRATGDIVGLMHSDDVFANQEVLSKVAALFNDPSLDGVYGDLEYVSSSNPAKVLRYWRAGDYSRSLLAKGWMPPHPTVYLRRQVFEKWGLDDTSFRIAGDYDALLRFLWVGRIRVAYLPEVLVRMRLGGESNASIRKIILKSHEDLRAIRRNKVGGLPVLLMKNIRKLPQLFQRARQNGL